MVLWRVRNPETSDGFGFSYCFSSTGFHSRDNDYNISQDSDKILNYRNRGAVKNVAQQIEAQTGSMANSSSAIEEMIASIQNIGTIANSQQTVIDSLSQRALESVKNMESNLTIITKIAESADSISEFTQIINAIAVQTNILSMNAAIEAAHTGDFGKGFGVVADEIRKLAENTASNAVSISSKLNETIVNIHEAQTLTSEANKSVQSMTNAITEVAQSVTEIIQGLTEMTVGSRQISESLADLNTISVNVSNSAKQIDAASNSIEVSMADVGNLSNMNTNAIGEISAGINDLVKSVTGIHQLGEENLENIQIVEHDLAQFQTIDVSKLNSGDGQALIIWNDVPKIIPVRPENPDLIVFAANDVQASLGLIKKVHSAGIPMIAATSMPSAEAFPYLVGYTGTDEWGAFRQLARKFADSLDKSGGYTFIQHMPGSGSFSPVLGP